MRVVSPRLGKLCILITAVLVASSLWCLAAEFSADLTITEKKTTTTGKIFASADKFRQEMSTPEGTNITIIRLDKKVMWTLLPDNTYMEISGDSVLDPAAPKAIEYEVTKLGTEEVNGYICEKLQYVYDNKSLGSMIQWMSSDLQYAVRTEFLDKKGKTVSVMNLTNIKPGAQSDSLFEIPSGYSKFELPIKLPFDLFGKK